MNIILEAKKLGFPLGEYVIVGSGILGALGLRESRDLDVAVSEKLLKELRASGKWKEETRYNNRLFLVSDGVDVITQLDWENYATTTQEAIDSALIIDGVPFLNIEEIIKFKTAVGREKDLKDIELLKKYVEGN
jgi:hypothetical protein